MKPMLLLLGMLLGLTGSAQNPMGKWSYALTAPVFGSAAAADMDGDGHLEIVFTTYTNDGRAHCLNAEDGSVSWIFDMGGCGDVAPLVFDVDGDQELEVLLQGSCQPTLFCVNGLTGQLEWSLSTGGGDSPPAAADVDGDGTIEIVLGNFQGEVLVVNGQDGSMKASFLADPLQGPIQTEPCLVDVNADGRLDVIVGNYFNNGLYLWAYDWQSGQALWTVQQIDSSSFHAYHGGALADVDMDGDLEYVIGTNNGYVRAIHVEDGSEAWSLHIAESTMGAVSIADLNGDGTLEVVVVNNDWVNLDERIWVLEGSTGTVLWSFPLTYSSFRGCAVADVNGNDTLDLVASTFMGRVLAVEAFGGLLWELDLADSLPAGLPYVVTDNAPILADFDADGQMDVFVAAGYGTYLPDSQNTGKAFMFEAGMGNCPSWTMFRQDARRSGYLSAQDIQEACEVSGLGHEGVSEEFLPYPNPTQTSFRVDAPDALCFVLYDLQGMAHRHWCGQALVDVRDLATGLYVVHTEQEGNVGSLLLQIVRP